jgi:NarL family two-component system response regulator YdfI
VEVHHSFRQAASKMFDHKPDLEVVAQATSEAEGRQKVKEGGIDTAIVDIPIPDEGAAEWVRELHEANPSIPVLVLTTIEDEAVQERFLEAGASEVLSKESTMEGLIAAVRRLGDQA